MQAVRRIYVYLVSAISLIGVAWAVIGLIRLIIDKGIGQGQIIGLASWLAVIIVGLPIFLFHWLMAQRQVATSPDERISVIRKIFLYGVFTAGVTPISSNVYRLVNNLLLTLVGGDRPDYYPYNLTTGEHLAVLLVWGVVIFYLWRQILIDRRPAAAPQQAAPTPEPKDTSFLAVLDVDTDPDGIRRVYLLIFALAGLVMVTWGAAGLLQTLMQFTANVTWRTPVANHVTQVIIGAVVWVIHWGYLQRAFFSGAAPEERSVLRKLYLYLAVFVFSLMAVGSGAALLKRLLELALGAPPSTEPLLSQLSLPVPLLVVGGALWAYHGWVLSQDSVHAPEAPRQAGVRRIYAYLVAAIGLAVLLVGLGGLLSLLVDLIISPAEVGFSYYRDKVAVFVSMIVVGAPVWLLPWRAMQGLALAPVAAAAPTGTGGEAERRSVVRKAYLYFFIFVGAIAIFSSVGWFVFNLLTVILGADLPDDFLTQVLTALIISLLAAAVWLYHGWAVRRDGQLEQKDRALRLRDLRVVVLDHNDGSLSRAVVAQLQQVMPGLQPVTVPTASLATETEAVTAAQFIIGPWQSLTHPAVAASPGLKLALPLPAPNWAWVGISPTAPEYLAQQAARGVQQALAGDEISPTGSFNVGAIVATIAGVLLFLVVISGLLGVVISGL
jgi:hypothetical protein